MGSANAVVSEARVVASTEAVYEFPLVTGLAS
jgi:hypothetical protein